MVVVNIDQMADLQQVTYITLSSKRRICGVSRSKDLSVHFLKSRCTISV